MIEALIAGETNPTKLASLADRRVKGSQDELREALRGRVTKQHRFLLRVHLNQIDCSPPSITCSRMERCTRTSAAITSIAAPPTKICHTGFQ